MNSYVLSAIILSALITFLLRAFPFLLFKEKELSGIMIFIYPPL